LTREDYYQLAYPIPKGSDARRRAEGIEAFRARVAALRPDLADRVEAIASMDDVFVLDVRLDRLRRWYTDGLLCLGDAAHAMTPVGGVGINLAIQDAVAATRLLAAPLREHRLTTADLARVQQRRQRPAVILQTMQRTIHLGVGPLLSGRITVRPPWGLLRLASRAPQWMVRSSRCPRSPSQMTSMVPLSTARLTEINSQASTLIASPPASVPRRGSGATGRPVAKDLPIIDP
jgi:2-polyprenyl-6-methoxyphenol hydroxylase-like FAD-dependent oxidoreductase